MNWFPFDRGAIPVVSGDQLQISVPHGLVRFEVTGAGTILGYKTDPLEIVWVGQFGSGYFVGGEISRVDPTPRQCPECLGECEVVLFVSKETCQRCGGEGHIYE